MSPFSKTKPVSRRARKPAAQQAQIMKMAELLKQMADGTFDEDTTEEPDATPTADGSTAAKSEEKVPTGMLAEIKNLYQKTDKLGRHQWVTDYPEDAVEAAE